MKTFDLQTIDRERIADAERRKMADDIAALRRENMSLRRQVFAAEEKIDRIGVGIIDRLDSMMMLIEEALK